MFRINRSRTNSRYSTVAPSNSILIRKSINSPKSGLKRELSDINKLNKKITTEKLNSFKRLTKQNIRQLNALQYKQRQKNILKKPDSLNQQTNSTIKNSLPQIPQYKPQNSIQQLPTRKIESQEDMAKLFNSIMNGDSQDMIKPIQKQQNNLNSIQENSDLVSNIQEQFVRQKVIDTDKIIQRLKSEILDQKNINYIRYIEIAIGLKTQFPTNTMIKSIILRALDRHNRQQYYKIPDDKLKDIVSIILEQIK